jgi:hypothetical protein
MFAFQNALKMPGGDLVAGFGGKIVVQQQGQFVNQSGTTTTGTTGPVTLDVGLWEMMAIFRSTEVTHSGCAGSVTRRRVAYDYVFRCEIVYDRKNPPKTLLQNGAGIGLEFYLGDPTQYEAGQNQKYASPSALLENCQTVTNSTGTDVVRIEVTGRANSHAFLLPDEQTQYTEYIAYLQNRGWL